MVGKAGRGVDRVVGRAGRSVDRVVGKAGRVGKVRRIGRAVGQVVKLAELIILQLLGPFGHLV